jgi:hypothetical protein
MRKHGLVAAVGVISTPLMALPAWALPCVTGSVASYETPGFSCSVDGFTFSGISVTTVVSGSGSVTLGSFSPFTSGGESGLALTYSANTGTTPGSTADVAWIYNVTGNIVDAFMSFTGTTTGTGQATSSETLSNNVTLSLTAPGSVTATFSPVTSLGVIKDQNDFAGSSGSAETSVLENGFSTPLPGALPLFATGLAGLWGLRRKRNKRSGAAVAA